MLAILSWDNTGFGNYQVNGLPGTSNGFIVDGLETNDPLTNLNSGLSTNLVLGLNSMQEITVNITSYRVDRGRYAASQVNYVTKSGTNTFHGNAVLSQRSSLRLSDGLNTLVYADRLNAPDSARGKIDYTAGTTQNS